MGRRATDANYPGAVCERQQADARLIPLYDRANEAGRKLLDACIGQQPLGAGAEKVVYPYGEDKVVAFFTREGSAGSVEEFKRSYYAIKLAHMVMPECVPDVHVMGSNPPLIVADRVIPKVHPRFTRIFHESKLFISAGFMERKLSRLGFLIDSNRANFIRDTSGNLRYVDSVYFWGLDNGRLGKSIDNLGDYNRRRAHRWLDKLLEPGTEM